MDIISKYLPQVFRRQKIFHRTSTYNNFHMLSEEHSFSQVFHIYERSYKDFPQVSNWIQNITQRSPVKGIIVNGLLWKRPSRDRRLSPDFLPQIFYILETFHVKILHLSSINTNIFARLLMDRRNSTAFPSIEYFSQVFHILTNFHGSFVH